MSALTRVRGQDAALRVLTSALEGGKLASAYLFHGPPGVGKELAARSLAVTRIAGSDETLARRIEGKNHPDVRVFGPREDGAHNLEVEFIRTEVLPFAQFAPFEAKSAFVIFPEADVSFPEFATSAANALLKTLEEPRPNVHFVLVSSRPNRLLPTIRSRCQPLRFAPLPADVLEGILEAEGIPNEARAGAVALARGRADRALDLARSGKVDAVFDRALELHRLTLAKRPSELYGASERLTKLEEDDRALDLEALALLYRDLALTGASVDSPTLAFAAKAQELAKACRTVSLAAFGARESAIQRALDLLGRGNASVQVVLDALFFELARAV